MKNGTKREQGWYFTPNHVGSLGLKKNSFRGVVLAEHKGRGVRVNGVVNA